MADLGEPKRKHTITPKEIPMPQKMPAMPPIKVPEPQPLVPA